MSMSKKVLKKTDLCKTKGGLEKMTNFKAENNKFWILEQREVVPPEEPIEGLKPKKKKEGKTENEPKINAWVYSTETEAIADLKNMIASEEIDFEADDPFSGVAEKYNLQEIEIASEKYNVKPISWAKIAFMLMVGEKIG